MANMSLFKNKMPILDPNVRNKNFEEVALGYTEEQAKDEAMRCLNCKEPKCVLGCPVNIQIPSFIKKISEGDYDSAYNETCASVAMAFFMYRMLQNECNSEYTEVLELELYNGALAGMQLDGKRFFYVNPLEAITGISGISPTHKHALPERPGWYGCACCPPNVARTITDIADYAWLKQDDTLYSVLFMENEINLDDDGIKVTVKTEYPYDGKITYSVSKTATSNVSKLAVRIPSWARKAELSGSPDLKSGFAYYEIPSDCKDIVITIDLKLTPRKIYCNNAVSSNTGKAAFAYGPLIYCAEEVDNGKVLNLFAKRGAAPELKELSNELCGIRRLKIEGLKVKNSSEDSLYSEIPSETEPCEISLIPYYTWANRGLNQMRVWLPEM